MLNVLKTALAASTAKIGVVTNNIANVGTTAFKRSDALFQDIYLTGGNANGPTPGSGSKIQINRVTHHPAELKRTGVTSDLGINGWGMFMLGKPDPSKPGAMDGEVTYTRNGSFQLDSDGFLTSNDGNYVLSKDSEPIQIDFSKNGIPLSEFNVSSDGFVMTAYGMASAEPGKQLGLAAWDNPAALVQMGNGRFKAAQLQPSPNITDGEFFDKNAGYLRIHTPGEAYTGKVMSSHLEVANVDLTKELVSLIHAQQSFSAASKAIQTDSDMISRFTKQ
jgi:flagellar basal-body rod protein FlgG